MLCYVTLCSTNTIVLSILIDSPTPLRKQRRTEPVLARTPSVYRCSRLPPAPYSEGHDYNSR